MNEPIDESNVNAEVSQTHGFRPANSNPEKSGFNSRLLFFLLALNLILGFRLAGAALESANWRGFGYSMLQILIVSAGSYFAIRTSGCDNLR